jgi:hypothetical protein
MKSPKNHVKNYLSSFQIKETDLPFAAIGIALAGYLSFTDPYLLMTVAISGVIAASLYFISACLPAVSKTINFRVSIWHIATIMFVGIFALNALEPAHAIFLSKLQDAVIELSGTGNGGISSISENQITTVFSFIRIALVLVAMGGAFAAWQQQQQGQNFMPIIMFVGGLFGVVLAVDLVTAFVIDAGGT